MYYNCHIHTFTDEDVPDRYLPLALARILKTKLGSKALTTGLRNLIPFTHRDLFDKYAAFITIGKLRDQAKILHECAKFYPERTGFFVHTMDMNYMGAGKINRSYRAQLEELGEIALKNPKVHPFMMVDPRRPDVVDLLKEMHTTFGFKGIKLYPPLGYFPYDERLRPVFAYCNAHRLPVMAHCGPFNPTYFKGSKKELHKLLEVSRSKIVTKGKSNQELCTYFTHPRNYEAVFKEFPDLKICLAHFGSGYYWDKFIHHPESEDNWFTVIREMIVKYPSLYTDISFTMSQYKYFSLLKVILADQRVKEKVLFGSDFYMVRTKADERRFGLDLRAFIGEENYDYLARINPEKYLA